MQFLGRTCHVLAALAVIAAIWSPVGAWWQFLATALLLFLAGAMVLGLEAQTTAKHSQGGEVGPQTDDDSSLIEARADGITPADVAQYKRTYGRKADR
jgi:hypothetical protein